uniref:ATP synthase complex subunit 8 n=1 Tax=Asbolus verrucosus TaxID=1661398 RepID=A0A0U2C5V3_ASBVE|nr:ATP synthase F0 subunit 8 [Asbolus verrucosus]AKJ52244.1 ATP synthase F0 subunit 8 [Asbolus verrucosus]
MPQMAPLNWLTLMTLFIMIFTLFNMLNYFSFTQNTPLKKMKAHTKTQQNWKW